MAESEHCPGCGAEFRTRSAIVDFGVAPTIWLRHQIPPTVKCPACALRFRSRAIRYFGFLDASRFRGLLVLGGLLAAAAVFGLIFL
ncbi:hypothetical protein GCM10027193_23500 [Arenimonas aestuarii]